MRRGIGYAPGVPEATVRDVMTPIRVACPSEATLRDAAAAMTEAGVGALVVEGERPAILSERDLLRPIAAGLDMDTERVADHVRANRPGAQPAESLIAVSARMSEQNVRHVLVLEGSTVVGMLSMRDVVRVIGRVADA